MTKFRKISSLGVKIRDLQNGFKWLDENKLSDYDDEEALTYISTFMPRPHGALQKVYTDYILAKEYFLDDKESDFLDSVDGNQLFDLAQELYENGFKLSIDKIE